MDFLFKNNQDVGEEKTDQGELTRPGINKISHKTGASLVNDRFLD
jgi:hypothetical protein